MSNKIHARVQIRKIYARVRIHKALLTSEMCDQSGVQQISDYLYYVCQQTKNSPIFHRHVHNIRLTRV